jgi:hypothetical protein
LDTLVGVCRDLIGILLDFFFIARFQAQVVGIGVVVRARVARRRLLIDVVGLCQSVGGHLLRLAGTKVMEDAHDARLSSA